MPYIQIKTNVAVLPKTEELLKSAMGTAIYAIPGKSEAWLMFEIQDKCRLWFQGTNEPCAMVEVHLFGQTDENETANFTALATKEISERTGVPQNRIFVKYAQTPLWGWNATNF